MQLYTVPAALKMEEWLVPAVCTQPFSGQVEATMPPDFTAIGEPQGQTVTLQVVAAFHVVSSEPFMCFVNTCAVWELFVLNNQTQVCPATAPAELSYYYPVAPDRVYPSSNLVGQSQVAAYICFGLFGLIMTIALGVPHVMHFFRVAPHPAPDHISLNKHNDVHP